MSLDTGDERKNGRKSRKVSAVKGSSADSESGGAAAGAGAGAGAGDPAPIGPEEDEGVQKVRALARRTLALCQRSDWVAVEQSLKGVERTAQEVGIDSPLADVADEVSQGPRRQTVTHSVGWRWGSPVWSAGGGGREGERERERERGRGKRDVGAQN